MIDDFLKIKELESVLEDKSGLVRRAEELSTPLLTDLTYIPVIYRWFCGLSGYDANARNNIKVRHKKYFLFVVLFLYSPAALVGGHLIYGVRDGVAKVLGYSTPSGVSNHIPVLMSDYCTYKNYMMDVDQLYNEIRMRLAEEGILPY